MTAPSFEYLAEEVCAIAGAPLPDLTADRDGLAAFSLHMRGVEVIVTHDARTNPDHLFVLVIFGPVPENRELEILRELLYSNMMMMQASAPAFSRNPVDGNIALQYTRALAEISAHALVAGVSEIVDEVLEWRRNFFLAGMASHFDVFAPGGAQIYA